MVRTRKPPSQTWRTFLANHVPDITACDFFTVPTVTFRVLYVFIVLRHDRRKVKGQPGVRIELEMSYQHRRKHLPVATTRRAA
jgi:hypothetical protein